ncbi:hypothetical protein KM043_011195 [Ampulex compressa]|nr:hypothetical protein KM043_011195 [Ampulex compressa]
MERRAEKTMGRSPEDFDSKESRNDSRISVTYIAVKWALPGTATCPVDDDEDDEDHDDDDDDDDEEEEDDENDNDGS